MRLLFLFAISLVFLLPAGYAQDGPDEEAMKKAYPCMNNPNAQKLDFWLGTWEVFVKGKKVGENVITKAPGGCALHEHYTTPGLYSGQSINYYNPVTKKYTQNWVGSAGDVTTYVESDAREGYLQFLADHINQKGEKVLRRMTFTYLKETDEVQQLIEDSTDNGETWAPGFLGLYKRKK